MLRESEGTLSAAESVISDAGTCTSRDSMNRFTGPLMVLVFGFAMAWGQAPAANSSPAPQTPAAQTTSQRSTPAAQPSSAASSPQQSISGCMTERFGIFTVDDTSTSKAWQVKAPGTSLYADENHVVTVKGVSDPKSASPILYAENVQVSGQPCGNAQAANGTSGQTATGANGATGASTSGTTMAPAGSAGAAASTGTTTSTTGATGTQSSEPGTAPSTPKASPGTGAAASGTASNPATQPSENKGVPNAGTPTSNPPQSNPPQQ